MKVQVSSILDEKGAAKAWKVKKIYPWGIIEAICDHPGRLNDGRFDHKVNHLWNKFIHRPTPKNLAFLVKAYKQWRKRVKNLKRVKILEASLNLDTKIVEKIKQYPLKRKRVKLVRKRIIKYVDKDGKPIIDPQTGDQLIEEKQEDLGEEEIETLEDAIIALHREICKDPELAEVYKPRKIPETIIEIVEEERVWEQKSQQT